MDPIRANSQVSINKTNTNYNNVEKQLKYSDKATVNPEAAKPSPIDKKDLDDAVDKANKVIFKNNTHLKFEVHEKTKDVMVKIINDETGETLKEFPPEKILDMVAKLWEIAGLFVDEKR